MQLNGWRRWWRRGIRQRDGVAPMTITVDGERFAVAVRRGEPGTYHLTWVSGPAGLGFTTATSSREDIGPAGLEAAARDFLRSHDPQDR